MIITSLTLNENLEEQVPRNAAAFPVLTCYEDMSMRTGGYVPWHWHPDVEFLILIQGGIRLCTNSHTYNIQAGEGAFINSNMLHYKEPLPGPTPLALNQLFDIRLLTGFYKSVFEQKYTAPVLECRELEALQLRPSNTSQRKILDLLRHSYDAADSEEEGYEFTVRNDLSSAWFLLFREVSPLLHSGKVSVNLGEERAKKMMLFIQSRYQEKLSLAQIASAASISERECLRCFRQTLNTSPFTYLLEYRTRMAADALRSTRKSVTEIAGDCGFGTASYFGKIFHKVMDCTPSQYRSLHKG